MAMPWFQGTVLVLPNIRKSPGDVPIELDMDYKTEMDWGRTKGAPSLVRRVVATSYPDPGTSLLDTALVSVIYGRSISSSSLVFSLPSKSLSSLLLNSSP